MIPSTTTSLQEIQKIYQDVSDWLKFAEAKHAGLFAAWVAIFIAVLTEENFYSSCLFLKSVILILIIIGALINLISFIPFLNRSTLIRNCCYNKYKMIKGNIVFYQSIFVDTYIEGNYSPDNFHHKYKTAFLNNIDNIDNCKLLDDYISQVIETSTVGTIKVYLFSLSAKYAGLLFLLLAISVIIA